MTTVGLKQLLKTTDSYIQKLSSVGIKTPTDLLWHLPRAYEDRTVIKTIEQLTMDNSVQTVKVQIVKKQFIRTVRGKQLVEMQAIDEHEHRVMLRFLNMAYLIKTIAANSWYYVVGTPLYEKGQWMYRHPELIEAQASSSASDAHRIGSIYPVYAELQGISRQWFHKKIYENLEELIAESIDIMPAEIVDQYGFVSLQEMFRVLHAPQSFEALHNAKERIYFTKLLQRQLNAQLTKQSLQHAQQTSSPDRLVVKSLLEHLPFELTTAQKRCIKEIIEAVHGPVTMLKLLQGDVGSGKTIVAATAAYYLIQKTQGQVVFLAPLEVLAQQQFRSLAKLLLPLGIRVELLTGFTKASEKKRIKQGLLLGQIPLVVGTHALLQDDIMFANLKLAVIDEQHKFGVKQRAFFQQFGSPHILQMTATPIPRSLALAFFGEFTISTIDEMPAGRKPIITKIVSESEWTKLKPWILTKIGQGQRVFVITPLIEESEFLDEVKSVKAQYALMKDLYEKDLLAMKKNPSAYGISPGQGSISDGLSPIGLLHGKMKPAEKDAAMLDFKEGKTDMLVSTTVIEVGIDIPEATVMIIMNAERFGLSQLHQLRGRVGRNDIQSYCFLETKNKSGDTYQRLRHMETTSDGFKLAELDLQLRGAGEFLGTRQSGDTDIPLETLTDAKLLARVQSCAEQLMKNYPEVASALVSDGSGAPVLA